MVVVLVFKEIETWGILNTERIIKNQVLEFYCYTHSDIYALAGQLINLDKGATNLKLVDLAAQWDEHEWLKLKFTKCLQSCATGQTNCPVQTFP